MASALELPDYWLEMDSEGEPLPVSLLPLTLARSLNRSPEEIRAWDENDALDELMWREVEGRRALMQRKEMERDALRR